MSRTLQGRVVSTKMSKTIVVAVERRKSHPLYKKSYLVTTRFQAHDEKNEAKVGDKVSIIETRPISARKRFVLNQIIEKPMIRDDIAGDVDVKSIATKSVKSNTSKKENEETV
mgnify:CR=1 FL=1